MPSCPPCDDTSWKDGRGNEAITYCARDANGRCTDNYLPAQIYYITICNEDNIYAGKFRISWMGIQ